MPALIEAESLEKEFKVVEKKGHSPLQFFFPTHNYIRAVDDVSLEIKKGEFVGLLGPNGSGKTTLIKLLCGLLQPTKGTVLIEGNIVEKELNKIGVMLSSQMIYYRMSGYNNLKYFAKLYGTKGIDERIMELAELVELEEKWLYNFVELYSLGMKTKLALARALIHDPPILLLDEPTQGLDPWVSKDVREKIAKMKKTILVSSHSVQDLEQLCNRVIVLDKGKIVSEEAPEKIKRFFDKKPGELS